MMVIIKSGAFSTFQIPFPHITSCPCQGTPSAVHLRWRPLDLPVPCIQRPAGSGLISVDADDADIQSWKCWNLSTLGWTLDCANVTERARKHYAAGSRQNINISYLQTGKTSELKWIFHYPTPKPSSGPPWAIVCLESGSQCPRCRGQRTPYVDFLIHQKDRKGKVSLYSMDWFKGNFTGKPHI